MDTSREWGRCKPRAASGTDTKAPRPVVGDIATAANFLSGAADDVKLHEVCGAADAHGGACDDADDVAFADEAFFEQAFFSNGCQSVNFADVGNMAGHYAPDERHAAAGLGFGRGRGCGERG